MQLDADRSRELKRILLVEDDEEDYMITRDLIDDIEAWDAKLDWVSTYEQAIETIAERRHDVYLVDYRLGGRDGLELLREAVAAGCRAPLILLTGLRDHEVDLEAMNAGAADFLNKGRIDEDQLERAIRYALERQQAKELLAQANDALQRKNQKLAELTDTAHRFVDNVAHEFRTPLTVVKEFTGIIADGLGGPVTKQQVEYLQFITAATRDLAQMVDDFLDSGKLKAGTLRVNRRQHTVDELFDSVRSMLRTRAISKSIALEEELDHDLLPFFGDLEKAGRVIINLTVNAIKFSPECSRIKLWAKNKPGVGIQIGITDQGPGLSEEDVAAVFERFKQVGDVQRASTKGFGLGLNIAKELIWLNLGTVEVTSKLGEGSTFAFTLPFNEPQVILDAYFQRLAELDEPPNQMVVLEVATEDATDQDSQEKAWEFMVSACYPMDVVLLAGDGESLIVIGSTTETDRWIARLSELREKQLETRPGSTPGPLTVSRRATWKYEDGTDTQRQQVLELLSKPEPSCV